MVYMIDMWIIFFGFFIGFIYGLYKKHSISTAILYGVIGSILIPIVFFILTVFFTLLTAFIILITHKNLKISQFHRLIIYFY